jgi:tRNA A-37 threonylcarbamoyl transferase component Bud32
MAQSCRCPQCGAEVPDDVPEGLCPQCLLKQALETKSGSDVEAQVPPTVDHSADLASAEPEILPKGFPDLEILEFLGRGGMGVVYKARQTKLDRLVALKILPPESGGDPAFAGRFTREAQALAKLAHPNIVGVYDFGKSDGRYYFTMEFVDGVNLRQLLRIGQLEPTEALKIVPQICQALQYAHDQGVVHRDIKPENILLDKKGQVRIADFGLAKLVGHARPNSGLTRPQQVMGTPNYMAPEQIEKPLAVDHRADIFSLGVVLYEMLTGELPLGRFALPSQKAQVEVRLDEVVLRALEKEPERRYQHVSDMATALTQHALRPSAKLWLFWHDHSAKGTRARVLLGCFGMVLVILVGFFGALPFGEEMPLAGRILGAVTLFCACSIWVLCLFRALQISRKWRSALLLCCLIANIIYFAFFPGLHMEEEMPLAGGVARGVAWTMSLVCGSLIFMLLLFAVMEIWWEWRMTTSPKKLKVMRTAFLLVSALSVTCFLAPTYKCGDRNPTWTFTGNGPFEMYAVFHLGLPSPWFETSYTRDFRGFGDQWLNVPRAASWSWLLLALGALSFYGYRKTLRNRFEGLAKDVVQMP